MKKIDYDYLLENVADIDICQKLFNNNICVNDGSFCHRRFYFRGQSNSNWSLTPSIVRDEKPEPKINSNCNLFDEIAKFQHNGVKTRFLDFTTNFLVALFFACDEKYDDIDGKLFVCEYYDALSESSNYTKFISYFTQLTSDVSFEKFCDNFNIPDDEKHVILAFLESGFMIQPSQEYYKQIETSNKKMYLQQGCFYVPSNDSNYSEIKYQPKILSNNYPNLNIKNKISLDWLLNSKILVSTILIPENLKKDIRVYLKSKNITSKALGFEE